MVLPWVGLHIGSFIQISVILVRKTVFIFILRFARGRPGLRYFKSNAKLGILAGGKSPNYQSMAKKGLRRTIQKCI